MAIAHSMLKDTVLILHRRYFSHSFPDPSLAAGASERPARQILYTSGRTQGTQSYMMRMHALLPPLQGLCCMLFTGVAKGGTRGRGHAPLRKSRELVYATYYTPPNNGI